MYGIVKEDLCIYIKILRKVLHELQGIGARTLICDFKEKLLANEPYDIEISFCFLFVNCRCNIN